MHVTISKVEFPEDIHDYAGLWVAIRGNEVVLSSADLGEIFADPRYVRATDVLFPVPQGERLPLPLYLV